MSANVEEVLRGWSTSLDSVTVDTTAWTEQPQPGDILVFACVIRHGGGQYLTALTGHGLTWTERTLEIPTQYQSHTIWTAEVPAEGVTSTDVTATVSTTSNATLAQLVRVSGGNSIETFAGNRPPDGENNTYVFVDLAGVSPDALIVAGVGQMTRVFTVGAGWTDIDINFVHPDHTDAQASIWGGPTASGGAVTVDGTLSDTREWAAGAVAIDPLGPDLTVTMSGDKATLDWSAPEMSGVTHIDIFRRGPYATEGEVPTEEFDPEVDTAIARVLDSQTTYDDEGLADGFYAWQVFPVQVS